jgi:DNA-binding protein H-NS
MTFDELVDLRDKVDSLIASMAAIVKRDLQDKLARLGSLSKKANGRLQKRPHALRGRKIAPKYRNPKNRSETWAGRGMMPLWMRALVRQGRKPDEFAIKGAAAPARRAVKRGRRKAR